MSANYEQFGNVGPDKVAALISDATGAIADGLRLVPGLVLPKYIVQLALDGISIIAREISLHLPDAETAAGIAAANAIADAEAEMAALQDLMEQLDIERVELLDDFEIKADSIKNDQYGDYLSQIQGEADVLGVTPEQLASLASDYYVSVGLLENYSLAQSALIAEARVFLTEYEQAIDSFQIVKSNQEFQFEIEKYTGYINEYNVNVPGSLEADFADLTGQYYIAVQEYVEQELLDQFDQDIEDMTAEAFNNASAFINSELALVDETDEGEYSDQLANDLNNKKQDQKQEAQDEADTKTDNQDLSDKLDNERESYQREAEEIAQATSDQASQHVKETLENNAQSELEKFFNELLQRLTDEANEEHSEVSCPNSHDKIYAWESEIKEQIDQLLNGADIVAAQSDAASDNQDRKARLEALVAQTEQQWTTRALSLTDAVENISEQEDPEDCGLDEDTSDKKIDFSGAEKITSPLVVDLDGDGIETLGQSEYIYFDHDGNGIAERTGWVAADDGLLVMDRDGDGQITSGNELFGSNTELASGALAANGFAALSEFDENSDAVIDQQDAAYNTIKVWQDIDSDGKVDDGELLSL